MLTLAMIRYKTKSYKHALLGQLVSEVVLSRLTSILQTYFCTFLKYVPSAGTTELTLINVDSMFI